jgi:uncharacterized protein (DUF1684 family)
MKMKNTPRKFQLQFIKSLLFIAFGFSLLATNAQNTKRYTEEIDAWHQKRVANLKSETSWLNLVGLYWLNRGNSTFGSGEGIDVKFPKGSIPEYAGRFLWIGKTVSMIAADGVPLLVDNLPFRKAATLFNIDSSKSKVASFGSVRWTIIKREDKVGVRVRDLNADAVKNFTGIERFPVDKKWQVTATLQPQAQKSIFITNVLGQTSDQPSPGKLAFTIGADSFTLDAIDEGDDELMIVFGDATSGNGTYVSGRFVYVKKPGTDGKTIIDFNKAYNPPCAFTDFATCPLPPKQNILPIAVTAGEKDYKHAAATEVKK